MKIGIDLGSSSTLAAFIGVEGDPILVPDAADPRSQATPSRVLLHGDRALIGSFAEKLGHENPGATLVSNFKRHFGTSHVLARLGEEPLYSEMFAALLLKKVRGDVEIYTGQAVDSCVLTVPAHFTDQQRRALLSAADIAGIEVIALLDEPIAAALQFTNRHVLNDEEIVVIYDIGGGTFDLSVLTCTGDQVHILAKSGLTDLGGYDFDRIIEQRFRDDFRAAFSTAPKPGALNDERIAALAEATKIALGQTGARWPANDTYVDGRFLRWTLDPADYDQRAETLLKRSELVVQRTLRGLGLELGDVQRFVLIGGACRSRQVRDFWRARLDPDRTSLAEDQPLASVAMGAALYAHSFARSDGGGAQFISNVRMSSVTGYNIGIQEEAGQAFERVIDKNMALPASGSALVRPAQGGAAGFAARICQYLDDPTLLDPVGRIAIQPKHLVGRDMIEIVVRYNQDGTLGVKVVDAASQAVVPFAFEDLTGGGRDLERQRKALAGLRVNTMDV